MHIRFRQTLGLFLMGSAVATFAYAAGQLIVRQSADTLVKQAIGTVAARIVQSDDYAEVIQIGMDERTSTLLQSDVTGVQFLVMPQGGGDLLVASSGDSASADREVPPVGLLDGNPHSVTWQTQSGLRFAAIVKPLVVSGKPVVLIGYTNLAPYESTISQLTTLWLLVEVLLLAVALGVTTVVAKAGSKRSPNP